VIRPYYDAIVAAKPVSYWPFDEASGDTFADVVGGWYATAQAGLTRVTSPLAVGQALRCAGGSRQASAGTSPVSQGLVVSWEWWFRGVTFGGEFSRCGPNRQDATSLIGYIVTPVINGGTNSLQVRVDTPSGANQTTLIPASSNVWNGVWRHLGLTLVNGVSRWYVDGARVTTGSYLTSGSGFQANAASLQAMAVNAVHTIEFAHAAMFDYELGDALVATHYLLGKLPLKFWNRGWNSGLMVTPSDTVDGPFPAAGTPFGLFEGIYVGGAGDVEVVQPNGVAVVFKSVPAGTVLPVKGRRINSALTTATGLGAYRKV
jgi:hypothetical protein